jgi:N-methylhydantoinase B
VANATFPAPCNNYSPSLHPLLSATQAALLAFEPPRRSAPDGLITIGYDVGAGRRAVQYKFVDRSLGASRAYDGAFKAHPFEENTPSAPIEVIESEFPLRLLACAPLRDTGGAGQRRGGVGCPRTYELRAPASFTLRR